MHLQKHETIEDSNDAVMKLCKGLHKRVSWQPHVISTVAHTVEMCRLGLGIKRGSTSPWLLFVGDDNNGKRAMAEALSELVFGEGKKPIHLRFCKRGSLHSPSPEIVLKNIGLGLSPARSAKMPMDRMIDALRMNPSSVVLFEDVDHADSMSQNMLLRAIERRRMVDTSGRDVSFNNAIVIMTSSNLHPGSNTSSEGGRRKHVEAEGPPAPAYCQRQQSSLTMHCNKRKGERSDDSITTFGSSLKRPCLGLQLDLNMSAEESATDDIVLDDPHIHPSNGLNRSQFEDESVLRGSPLKHRLQGFYDHADAVVVFDPTPL
jgi:DNA polymerase III delta prime subunit